MVRNGTCSIFVFTESLGGARHVSVRRHRTAADWAEEIRYFVDVSYSDCDKIILIMGIECNDTPMPVPKDCGYRFAPSRTGCMGE